MPDLPSIAPLKVLHVIDHLGPGGAQQSLYVLLKNMDAARYPAAVAVLHGDGLYRKKLESLGVRVYGLSSRRLNPLLPMRLAEVIKSHQPHIVHTHLAVSCIMAAAESLRNKTFRMVSHVRSENQFRYSQAYLKGAHGWANRRAWKIIAVSARVRDFLIDDERVSPGLISVIPNSFERMDEDAALVQAPRRHFGFFDDDQVAGCCARLDRNKGLEHLIGALDILRTSRHFSLRIPCLRFNRQSAIGSWQLAPSPPHPTAAPASSSSRGCSSASWAPPV